MRKIAAGLLACLALIGCGRVSEPDPPASAAPTTSPAAAPTIPARPTEDPNAEFGEELTADPRIVSPHAIPFQSWTRTDDGIALHFAIGSADCYGVDATVTETATTVVVELRSGTNPESVGSMCTMIATFATLEVPLKTPIDDRLVLSAA